MEGSSGLEAVWSARPLGDCESRGSILFTSSTLSEIADAVIFSGRESLGRAWMSWSAFGPGCRFPDEDLLVSEPKRRSGASVGEVAAGYRKAAAMARGIENPEGDENTAPYSQFRA